MRALAVIGLVAVLNFAAFFYHSMFLGGDALNGKIENGHYFVGEHGHYKEVKKSQFLASKVHGISIFVMFGLVALFGFDSGLDKNKIKQNPSITAFMKWSAIAIVGLMIVGGLFDISALIQFSWFCVPLPFIVPAVSWAVQLWNLENNED